jgi:hypothetical protein
LSNNTITKNDYTSSIFLVFFASILFLSLFMFYMPLSYSQTESEQSQQQVCAEGEVFNEQTQICESITSPEIPPTETPPTEEIQMDTNGDGVVDELDEVPQTPTTETPPTDEIQMDTNGDGVVDAQDEVPQTPTTETTPTETPTTETATEAQPTDEIQMDTNGDGVVDELDEVPQTPTEANTTTTTEPPTSGKVFKNFKSANYPCEWDLNGDGTIDVNDDPKLFWDGKIPVKYNEKVIALQTYLTDLGYAPDLEPEGIDGKFGPHTKNAVMAYQQNKGLIVDGIVGPNTWRALCDDIYFLLKED